MFSFPFWNALSRWAVALQLCPHLQSISVGGQFCKGSRRHYAMYLFLLEAEEVGHKLNSSVLVFPRETCRDQPALFNFKRRITEQDRNSFWKMSSELAFSPREGTSRDKANRAHFFSENWLPLSLKKCHFALVVTPEGCSYWCALFLIVDYVYDLCKTSFHHVSPNSIFCIYTHLLWTIFTWHISHSLSEGAQQSSEFGVLNLNIGPSTAFLTCSRTIALPSTIVVKDHFRLLPEHKHATSQLVSMETTLSKTDTVGHCFNKR